MRLFALTLALGSVPALASATTCDVAGEPGTRLRITPEGNAFAVRLDAGASSTALAAALRSLAVETEAFQPSSVAWSMPSFACFPGHADDPLIRDCHATNGLDHHAITVVGALDGVDVTRSLAGWSTLTISYKETLDATGTQRGFYELNLWMSADQASGDYRFGWIRELANCR